MALVEGERTSVPGYPHLTVEPIPDHNGFVTLHAKAGPVMDSDGNSIERWAYVNRFGELFSPDSGVSLGVALKPEDLEGAKQFVASEGLKIAFAVEWLEEGLIRNV